MPKDERISAGGALDLLRQGVEQVLDADRVRLVARRLAFGAAQEIHEARADVGDVRRSFGAGASSPLR